MKTSAWIEKKELRQADGTRTHRKPSRHIFAAIKRGLLGNQISIIKLAVCQLHKNPDHVAKVLNHLNMSLSCYGLSFEWYPDGESSAILIRTETTGVLIESSLHSMNKGMKIAVNASSPCHALAAEEALSVLSRHACRHGLKVPTQTQLHVRKLRACCSCQTPFAGDCHHK